jgi:ABC-2 type transport system permease protein
MASVAVAGRRASLAPSTAVIAKRSLLKFLRTPQLVWTATIQGVMFLVIFRYLFGGAIQAGTLGYVGFVVPGILTTMLIWQGMGAALSITEDRARACSTVSAPCRSHAAPCWPGAPWPTRQRKRGGCWS